MSYSGTTATLNTGAKIPAIGFGTWQDKDAQEDAVYEAIKAGYRVSAHQNPYWCFDHADTTLLKFAAHRYCEGVRH